MTTSGTSTFNPAITYVINAAYRTIGAIGEDETPTAGMYADAMFAAGSMMKEWMATGIHVWTEEEAILFLQQGQYRYLLGGSTLDNCCDANSYVLAQLAQPAIAGATTLTLLTAAGITNGRNIGVVLNSGTTFWTTVSGAPVGAVVTLASPLPTAAAAQNYVFAYTSKIVRPLKVPRIRLLYFQGLRETPMMVMSRKEYMDLPQKNDLGAPTQFFYSPQLVSGELYVWPSPQFYGASGALAARLTWYRPLMDFDSPADTADLPQEWINALVWNLAKEMGPQFDVPPQRWELILGQAQEKLDRVISWDRESEPIQFGIDWERR